MGGKPRKTPEFRAVILLVRPTGPDHPWWSKDDTGECKFAAIDPYDPPGWSLFMDPDYGFDSVELWKQLKATVEEHVAFLKEEWLEEHGPNEDGEGCEWEFELRDVIGQTYTSPLSVQATS